MAEANNQQVLTFGDIEKTINPTAPPSGLPLKQLIFGGGQGMGDFSQADRLKLAQQSAGLSTPNWHDVIKEMLPVSKSNPSGNQRTSYGNLTNQDLFYETIDENAPLGSNALKQKPFVYEEIFAIDPETNSPVLDVNDQPVVNPEFQPMIEAFKKDLEIETANIAQAPVNVDTGVTIAGESALKFGESEFKKGSVIDRYVNDKFGLAQVLKGLAADRDNPQFSNDGSLIGNDDFNDPLILQILNDELPIGSLLAELDNRKREVGRLPLYARQIFNSATTYAQNYTLNNLPYLGDYLKGGLPDDLWLEEQRYDNEQYIASVRRTMAERWGQAWITKEDFLNDFVHKKIKERLDVIYPNDKERAEKYYKDNYMQIGFKKQKTQFVSEELIDKDSPTGKKILKDDQLKTKSGKYLVPRLLFSSEDAEQILDYTFVQLPFYSKVGTIAPENIAFTLATAGVSNLRSASAFNKVYGVLKKNAKGQMVRTMQKDAKGRVTHGFRLIQHKDYISETNKLGYKYPKGVYTDRQVHKLESLENATNGLARNWVALRFLPGQLMGSAGAAGRGAMNQSYKDELIKVHEEINGLNIRLSQAKKLKLTPAKIDELTKRRETLLVRATGFSFARPGSALSYLGLSKLPRSPVTVETGKAELAITFGQALGAEWLPTLTSIGDNDGLSAGAGEALGALATILKLHRAVTFLPRKIGGLIDHQAQNAFSRVPEELGRMIENNTYIPFITPGLFVNRNLDEISQEVMKKRGSRLSNKERESLKLLHNLTDHLNPEEKQQMFEHMREVHDLREKIVNYFPEIDRSRIREVFSSTIAQMSSLLPIQAMEGISGGSVSFSALKNFKFKSLNNLMERTEQQYSQAMEGVARMQQAAEVAEIPPEKLADLNQLFRNQMDRMNEMQVQLKERANIYAESVQKYKQFVTGEVGILDDYDLTEDTLDDLYDLEGTLRRIATPEGQLTITGGESNVQALKQAREDLDVFTADMYDGLVTALDDLGTNNFDPTISARRGQLLERIFDIEMWQKKRRVKEIWKPVDDALKDQKPDIAPFIDDFISGINKTSDEPIHKMFSPKGRFFQGFLGKRMHSAFRQTIGKVMKNVKGADGEPVFTAENIQILSELAMKADPTLSTKPDSIQLFFMLKNGDFNKGQGLGLTQGDDTLAGVSEMLSMNIDYSDLMSLHNTVRDFSYSMSKKTTGDAKRQADIGSELAEKLLGMLENPVVDDVVIEGSNMTAKQMIKNAKAQTQAELYDVTTRPDTLAKDMINQSHSRKMPAGGVEGSTTLTKVDTLKSYSTKSDPKYYHDKFVKNFLKYMETGITSKNSDPVASLQELVGFWAKQEGGELVFDLSDKTSVAKFKAFQKVMESALYENWDGMRFASLKNLPDAENFEMSNFNVIENLKPLGGDTVRRMEEMQKILDTINIKNADGSIVRNQRLLDLEGMIQMDRSLVKLMAAAPEARKKARGIETSFKNVELDLKTKIDARIERDKNSIELLNVIAVGGNTREFAEKVLTMSPEELTQFKIDMTTDQPTTVGGKLLKVTRQGDKPLKIPATMTVEEFEASMAAQLLEGMFEIAEYGPSTKLKWQSGKNGTRYSNAYSFSDNGLAQLQAILDVNNPNPTVANKATKNIERLKVVLGEETTDVLATFAQFFTYNQLKRAGASEIKIAGLMRDISPNEMISRAFNLARGMVGPTYLMAELYLRLAGSHGIQIMDLALQNRAAGDLMVKMMKTPKAFSEKEAKDLSIIMQEFVFTELIRAGVTEIDFGSDEQIKDLYFELWRNETDDYVNNFQIFSPGVAGTLEEYGGYNPNNVGASIQSKYDARRIEEQRRQQGAA